MEPARAQRPASSPTGPPGLPFAAKVVIGVLAVIGAIALLGWVVRKLLWLVTVVVIVALGVTVVRALSSRSR